MSRLGSAYRSIGPRPLRLLRAFLFLAERERRRASLALRRRYGRRRELDLTLRLPSLPLLPASELPEALATDAKRIRTEADAIVEHRFDLLGSGPTDLGAEIDWQRDFRSGYRWQQLDSRRIAVVRLDGSGDPKLPWELSRCHQLLTLARAAVLFREERYAAELESQLESWLTANPPGVGINWTSSLELAIRSLNWIWALATVEQLRPLRDDLRRRVVLSLDQHGRQLAANIEGAPHLRDNHFVGCMLGLLAIGSACPDTARARRWVSVGARGLERELAHDVLRDGVWPEASLSYHGLVLEIFLLGRRLAQFAGKPFSAESDEQLRRMLEVVRALRHPNGRIPLFGDGDSGRVLPGGFDRPPDLDNLLWLGAAELGLEAPLAADPHPELAWTLGLESWLEARRGSSRSSRLGSHAFPVGGLYALASGDWHAAVHCGPSGLRGRRAHAHNDALSFELSLAGVPVIVDSGTYSYSGDPRARNRFRAAAAHNVIVLDGEEPSPIDPARLFELAPTAGCELEQWSESPERAELTVLARDYSRLPQPLLVRRRFTLTDRAGLSVEDELLGKGTHDAVSYLHLTPGAEVQLRGSVAEVVLARVRLRIAFSGFDEIALVAGEVSDRYGVRASAPVLEAPARVQLPARFGYRIQPG